MRDVSAVCGGGEGDHIDGELHDNLAEVVGVARPAEEAGGAGFPFVGWVGAEAVFLDVRQGFHGETDGPEDDAGDVGWGAESGLRLVGGYGGGVEEGDGEGDGPDPDHLEDPEGEEFEEVVAFVVEAVVFPRFDDAEEEEGGEAGAPCHDEEGVDDLPGIVGGGEGEGKDCQEHEVRAAGEVGQFVKLEGEGDGEEEELVGDCDEEGYAEVVVV